MGTAVLRAGVVWPICRNVNVLSQMISLGVNLNTKTLLGLVLFLFCLFNFSNIKKDTSTMAQGKYIYFWKIENTSKAEQEKEIDFKDSCSSQIERQTWLISDYMGLSYFSLPICRYSLWKIAVCEGNAFTKWKAIIDYYPLCTGPAIVFVFPEMVC